MNYSVIMWRDNLDLDQIIFFNGTHPPLIQIDQLRPYMTSVRTLGLLISGDILIVLPETTFLTHPSRLTHLYFVFYLKLTSSALSSFIGNIPNSYHAPVFLGMLPF